jgi:signal transduction histidine kinase
VTSRRASALPRRRIAAPSLPLGSVRGPKTAFFWLRGILAAHLSVRAKLTLWYGLMCAVTLGLVGVAMALYLGYQFQRDIDKRLADSSQRVGQLLPAAMHQVVPPSYPSGATQQCALGSPVLKEYCRHVQYILQEDPAKIANVGESQFVILSFDPVGLGEVRGPSGVPRPPSTTVTLQPLGLEPPPIARTVLETNAVYQKVVAQSDGLLLDRSYQGETFRAEITRLTLPRELLRAPHPSRYFGLLVVYQKEGVYTQVTQQFQLVLIVGTLLGLAIALAAGWLVARAALRPIGRISRTVRSIGESRDLGRRVNFVGPMDEVGRLAQTFDGMMGRLEGAFENQKRFIADASHELRTPLTAIRGNADLMRRAPPGEQEACLKSIRREAERMSRLVNDLLLLAEADMAEHPIHKRPVELDEALMDVYNSALVIAGDKVDIVLDGVEPVSVEGDADRLKQLMLNLVDNAVKFTPEGGTVSLRLSVRDGAALVEVSDSGIGIPPEEQQAIFERFHRVEASRSRRGTGLGLAICTWIVDQHGGEINVRSQLGKGSTFTIRLPGARKRAA